MNCGGSCTGHRAGRRRRRHRPRGRLHLPRPGGIRDDAGVGGLHAPASELIESERPDLIVLDVMLPEIDGLQHPRRPAERDDIPVILLTGAAEETDRVLGLRLGADDYVVKPFSPGELVARVERSCGGLDTAPHGRSRSSELVIDPAAGASPSTARMVDLTARVRPAGLPRPRTPGRCSLATSSWTSSGSPSTTRRRRPSRSTSGGCAQDRATPPSPASSTRSGASATGSRHEPRSGFAARWSSGLIVFEISMQPPVRPAAPRPDLRWRSPCLRSAWRRIAMGWHADQLDPSKRADRRRSRGSGDRRRRDR